jgi:hypothetical protein
MMMFLEHLKSWLKPFANLINKTITSWKITRKKRKYYNVARNAGCHNKGRPYRYRWIPIGAYHILCFSAIAVAMTAAKSVDTTLVMFDTDSYVIGVDNRATKSITNSLEDFIEPPDPINRKCKGIGGIVTGLKIGTIKWTILDDHGLAHDIFLPGSYYVPGAPTWLLSPQHWTQTADNHRPNPRGTWSMTYEDEIILWWDQRKYKRTLPLNPEGDNVGTLHSAPGYSKLSAFCAECESQGFDDDSPIAFETHVIPDDDSNGESSDSDSVSYDELHNSDSGQLYAELPANSLQTQEDKPLIEEFNLDGPISQDRESLLHVVKDEEDNLKATPAEFLKVSPARSHVAR